MKPRKSKRRASAGTESLPGLGHELIEPVSAKGEAPPATEPPGFAFPGFNEQPDEWGLTWNPKGEAPPASGFSDSLPGAEFWKDLAGKNPPRFRAVSGFYDYYMQSPPWFDRRAKVIERARGHCEKCGCPTERFEVHHKTYDRFGSEPLEDLEALCAPCHPKADAARREAMTALMEREREAVFQHARYAGFMRRQYGEDWAQSSYAYSLASFQEFEETTAEWNARREQDGDDCQNERRYGDGDDYQ